MRLSLRLRQLAVDRAVFQRKDLKASRIGHDDPAVAGVHEGLHAAGLRHDVHARMEHKVIGVGEDHIYARDVAEVDRFQRRVGRDGDKRRRFDHAVFGGEQAESGVRHLRGSERAQRGHLAELERDIGVVM